MVSVSLFSLCNLVWLISLILALKVLPHSGHVVPDGRLVGCCCLSFRFLLFSSRSARLLALQFAAPSWMMARQSFLSSASVS